MHTDISHMLKDASLKATPVRLAVLELFAGDCRPLDAESVSEALNSLKGNKVNKKSRTNLVTVYRTLATFEQAGILRRVDLHADSVQYELALHHHHHIVCTGCGLVESFEDCNVGRISERVLKESSRFDAVESHSLELFGTCKACAKA